MYKNLSRRRLCAAFALAGACVLTATPALSEPTQHLPAAPEPLKIGFVYVSPVGAAGWTFQHDLARQEVERTLGARVQATVVENVREGPDAERVMRDLAQQGHRLIFATSFGYLEPALRVAGEFPDVAFEHAGGFKTARNVNTYNARFYEARYLAGMLAGHMSRSGTAGYVAGFPVPEVIQGINAFTLGMRAVNPKAEVRVIWLNAWFDPPRERDGAQTLVNLGADVLTNHSGSTAVAQAAQALGVHLIAYQSDMRDFAPKAHLTSVTHHWGPHFTQVAQALLDGKWRATPVWGGMREGFVKLAPFSDQVPAAVAQQVRAREADILSGRFHPFSGRITDNTGTVRQAEGTMADEAIETMDYFVQGVVGAVPKR